MIYTGALSENDLRRQRSMLASYLRMRKCNLFFYILSVNQTKLSIYYIYIYHKFIPIVHSDIYEHKLT